MDCKPYASGTRSSTIVSSMTNREFHGLLKSGNNILSVMFRLTLNLNCNVAVGPLSMPSGKWNARIFGS